MSSTPVGECLTLDGSRFRRSTYALEPLDEDVCHVALSHFVFAQSERDGAVLAAGVGTVTAAGPAASDWPETRVVVPGQAPVSDERAASIASRTVPNGHLPVDLSCRARWLCPLRAGFGEELGPIVALAGREFLWGYSAVVHGDLAPGSEVQLPNEQTAAQVMAPFLAYRGVLVTGDTKATRLAPSLEYAHPDLVPELVALLSRGLFADYEAKVIREGAQGLSKQELLSGEDMIVALQR